MRHRFVYQQSQVYPVIVLCSVKQVIRSAYYVWLKRPAKLITADEQHLYRRMKALFVASRDSLGSGELSKKLREEGFVIGRYRTRTLMRKFHLKVQQRVKYKVTTKRKHSDAVADNLLNQNFNPVAASMTQAINLRQSKPGLVFHSDSGSQYTSHHYRQLLVDHGIRASMGSVGACWDNAIVERFFGSLKHDWILKVTQPTCEHMRLDVSNYIRYLQQ